MRIVKIVYSLWVLYCVSTKYFELLLISFVYIVFDNVDTCVSASDYNQMIAYGIMIYWIH